MSEASKVLLEHMFNSHDNCSADWFFKTRSSEEGKTHNDKDNEFICKQKNNQLHNLLKKTIFPFQTDKVIKDSLHMFDTQKNESMNNLIAYGTPKTRRWRTALALIIGSCALWGSPSLDSRNIGNECSLCWRYKQRQP